MSSRASLLTIALLAILALLPAGALAADRAAATTTVHTVTRTVTEPAGAPVYVSDLTKPPAGYRLTALQALAIARRSPAVRVELRRHPRLVAYEYTKGAPTWQVSWFTPVIRHGPPQRELLQVYVDDDTGRVTQAWTGWQVPWTMARGYAGAFGRIVNAWYLWIPLCLVFVAPFLPWRRRPTLWHLDLLVLLSFSVSLALFNHGQVGLSTPLFYPPLLYLFARLTLIAFGRGLPREPLRILVPTGVLAVAVVVLMGLRIALNVVDSNVIDVGFSGVIGATRLIHGTPLYGHWPSVDQYGDTYAPFTYLIYVPFRWALGWSGVWDSLPAAHGAAIFFDVATLLALYALGRRWRGHALGVVFTFLWAADPFTLWTLSSNTNDSLVALTVTLALLTLGSPPARGAAAALTGMTKFAPFILTPLLLRGTHERPRPRAILAFAVAFAVVVGLCMIPVLTQSDWRAFWHDSVGFQAGRVTPFSVWGLWHLPAWLQHVAEGAVVAFAVITALLPRRRGPVEVAALAAALLIALQLVGNYWLYSYVVWFLPAAIVALVAAHPPPGAALETAWADLDRSRAPAPQVPDAAGTSSGLIA